MRRLNNMEPISEYPSAEYVRSILRYFPDGAKYEDGTINKQEWFCWAADYEADVTNDSCAKNGYLEIRIQGEFYCADKLAWLIMTGEWPSHEIIHADGERFNNLWDNIREKALRPTAE
jgi:hypothetical protein